MRHAKGERKRRKEAITVFFFLAKKELVAYITIWEIGDCWANETEKRFTQEGKEMAFLNGITNGTENAP